MKQTSESIEEARLECPTDRPAAGSRIGSSDPAKVAFVYRIAPEEEWEAARGRGAYYGGKADERFLHLSTALQVPKTLNRFYHGRNDLYLLRIDVAKLGEPAGHLKWESADGDRFPHFYGPQGTFAPLPLEAIIETTKLELLGNNQHSLPSLTS